MTTREPAAGAQIKVLTSNSTRTVLDALTPAFERASGHKLSVIADSAKMMMKRIEAGETGDVVILGTTSVDELAKAGLVDPKSRRPFARCRVGVAVLKGAPKPDIATVEAFKRALLKAKSICHTEHGASGMYVPVLLERLGILDQVKPKIVTRAGGYIARVVVEGQAELAIQQIVELLAVPGVDLVGPIPDEVQKTFETSAGIFAASKVPAAAEALLQSLLQPSTAGVFREKGLDPIAD
jgi:molybdate transport system substrate-binding protein